MNSKAASWCVVTVSVTVNVIRTLGIPLTAQLSVVLYPAITERFTKG